ncbi:MAG: hypothetical protein Q7S61_03310 [bacterium]|nr:hypothetical protein [bacterium]
MEPSAKEQLAAARPISPPSDQSQYGPPTLTKEPQKFRFFPAKILIQLLKPTTQKMKLSLILFVIVILNSILFSPPFTYFSFIFLGPIHEYFIYPIMLFIFFFLSFPPYPLFGISFGFDLFFDVAYLYLIACLLTAVIEKVNQVKQHIYSSYSTLPAPLKTVISLSQTIARFKKPLVLVGFLIVIIVIVFNILVQFRVAPGPQIPTDTYKSEVVFPHQMLSDAYIDKYQSSSIEKVSVVYYEDNNKTYLREVETGRSVEISFTGGLFYITPGNQYFFINPSLGQAALIEPNSFQIINTYLFDSVDAAHTFSGSGTAWLSNFKLWINVAIFDLADSKMYRVQSPDHVILGNVETCGDAYVSCYKVTCENSGALLNISGRDKLLPQTTPSLGVPFGIVDYSRLPCISKRATQMVLVRSSNVLLILGVDGDKAHNYVLSISSRGEHEEEIKNAVDAQKYQSVGEFNPVDYLAGYEGPSENRMRNGKKIKFSYESIGPCLDSCELNYKTLTISNRLGIPEGRINRERIFLIGARRVHADNENGEVFFISEKGIEKVKL